MFFTWQMVRFSFENQIMDIICLSVIFWHIVDIAQNESSQFNWLFYIIIAWWNSWVWEVKERNRRLDAKTISYLMKVGCICFGVGLEFEEEIEIFDPY